MTWIKYTSAKTDLFGISRDLQLGVCKCDELCAISYMTRDKKHFCREEKEVRRDVVSRVHGFSLAGSLPGKNMSHSSSCGLIYHHKMWDIPLLVSRLYLTEVFAFHKSKHVKYQQQPRENYNFPKQSELSSTHSWEA